MSTIDYLPLANNPGANVVTQGDYVIDTGAGGSLEDGYQSGLARSDQMNKTWRQSSVMTAAIANFISAANSQDVLDDGDVAQLTADFLLAIQTIAAAAVAIQFTTGDAKLTLKTAADTGWVMCNDGTIGSAASGATTRANADTVDLYTLLWTNISNDYCPVTGGRGGSAAADFAANKAIRLTKNLGRALAVSGTGSTSEDCTASSANGLVVVSNAAKWITGMPVTISNLAGYGGTIAATNYFAVRVSATNLRLASTLALAQAGAPDITITGAGTATVTYSMTARVLGSYIGEEGHAMSVTELLAHTHANANIETPGTNLAGGANAQVVGNSGSTGGNAAMNIMEPEAFWNAMIKL